MPKFTYKHRVDNSIRTIELNNHEIPILNAIFIQRMHVYIIDATNKRVLYKHLGLPVEDENWRSTDE